MQVVFRLTPNIGDIIIMMMMASKKWIFFYSGLTMCINFVGRDTNATDKIRVSNTP